MIDLNPTGLTDQSNYTDLNSLSMGLLMLTDVHEEEFVAYRQGRI